MLKNQPGLHIAIPGRGSSDPRRVMLMITIVVVALIIISMQHSQQQHYLPLFLCSKVLYLNGFFKKFDWPVFSTLRHFLCLCCMQRCFKGPICSILKVSFGIKLWLWTISYTPTYPTLAPLHMLNNRIQEQEEMASIGTGFAIHGNTNLWNRACVALSKCRETTPKLQ